MQILISWQIGKQQQIGWGRDPENPYPYVKTIDVFNQAWTLNVKSIKPEPNYLVLKKPNSKKLKVTGNLEIYYTNLRDKETVKLFRRGRVISRSISRVMETTTTEFVKILEENQDEVALPIHPWSDYGHSAHSSNRSDHALEIHGYLNIYEISSPPPVEIVRLTDEKFHLKAMAKLSDDLCCLLKEQNADFADVKLKCHDVVIPAHINILSARSPVFAAMFRNKMKETLDRTVCVDDIDPKIFQTMLNYIYSGKTDALTASTAGQLLFAADKYQLEGLKEMCSDCLKTNLSLKNALPILVLADLHDSNLKSDVLTYICKSGEFPQLENSKEWKSIQREKPDLAMLVLNTIIKYLSVAKK